MIRVCTVRQKILNMTLYTLNYAIFPNQITPRQILCFLVSMFLLQYEWHMTPCNLVIYISTFRVNLFLCYFNTCTSFIFCYFVIRPTNAHNYFTNYHTTTCFDTIVLFSGSSQSRTCQVTQVFQTQLLVIQFKIKMFYIGLSKFSYYSR